MGVYLNNKSAYGLFRRDYALAYFVDKTEPLQVYIDEAELASIIRWVYLKALDTYRFEREDKAGVGYVNFIFYPFRKDDDAIIIELKAGKEVSGWVASMYTMG